MNVPYLLDRAVRSYGGNIFAICDGREATLGEINAKASALAAALSRLDVHKGDRVAVLLENSVNCIEVDFALAKGGYVRVSLNPRITAREAEYILDDAEPVAVIYGSSFAASLSKLVARPESVKHWICVNDGEIDGRIESAIDFAALVAVSAQIAVAVEIDDEDDYCIFYTSGSSGKPKGVVLTHRAMVHVAYNVLIEFGPLSPMERVLLLQPMSHGSAFFILAYAMRGASVVLMRAFNPDGVFKLIAQKRVTCMKLVPTMLHRLLEDPALNSLDLGDLRQVIYGGSHIANSTLQRAIGVFGQRLRQHYGQSEAPSVLTVLAGHDHMLGDATVLSSAGRPVPTVDIRIVGQSGERLDFNEIGEIVVRAPHVMKGYWRRPDLTAAALRDGWLYTNDLGKIDEHGYVYLLGRKDEMIISGGFNIAPKEVEDAICSHPAVREAAVIGKADTKWGQIVVAYVSVNESGLESAGLAKYLKPILGFKCPKFIKIIDDLPKNTNGKIDKRAIAQLG